MRSPNFSHYRSRYGLQHRHARPKPIVKNGVLNSKLPCPVRRSLALSVVLKESVAAEVILLLLSRLPPDITWIIVSVVIYPSNRVKFGGRFTNIFKEGLKGVSPTITDRDSSPAIVFVRFQLFIATSRYHSRPSRVYVSLLSLRAATISAPYSSETSRPRKARATSQIVGPKGQYAPCNFSLSSSAWEPSTSLPIAGSTPRRSDQFPWTSPEAP